MTAVELLFKDDPILRNLMEECLDAREQFIIASRFPPDDFKPRTLQQVADALGLSTRERVRQIQNIALSKLRRALMVEVKLNRQ